MNNEKEIKKDNLRALQFYQKRGYYLTKLYPNAMEKARKEKPNIPILGENNLQVYYGILKQKVNLVEEKNKLVWVDLNKELLNNEKFAGNYNIPHIIKQIKTYLKDESK